MAKNKQRSDLGGGGTFGGPVTGMCHFEKNIGAIIPCRKLKKGTHNMKKKKNFSSTVESR